MLKRLRALTGCVAVLCGVHGADALASDCRIVSDREFPADGEHVRLARQKTLPKTANFAVFRAPLAVNTDGAPTSYHPFDPLGQTKAINHYDNGISVRRKSDGKKPDKVTRLKVFEEWRDNGWTVPAGYKITWGNVIAANADGKPCVFQSGDNKGYFGSLTALQNALLPSDSGECGYKNQLDQRFIPAIVLRGDDNPLRDHGARTGDLVLAVNPETGAMSSAIIGDTGDGNRIGEGSVALNMALLGKTSQPQTYAQAVALDTGAKAMIVAVLPQTRAFERKRPYTADNIKARVESWAATNGYVDTKGLAEIVSLCAEGL